jgi:hypothetical protein
MFAHIAGVPVEELLPTVAGAGGALVAARAWLAFHLRRRSPSDAPGRAVGQVPDDRTQSIHR